MTEASVALDPLPFPFLYAFLVFFFSFRQSGPREAPSRTECVECASLPRVTLGRIKVRRVPIRAVELAKRFKAGPSRSRFLYISSFFQLLDPNYKVLGEVQRDLAPCQPF